MAAQQARRARGGQGAKTKGTKGIHPLCAEWMTCKRCVRNVRRIVAGRLGGAKRPSRTVRVTAKGIVERISCR